MAPRSVSIILVEDNATLRDELCVFLSSCGWHVRAVCDGLEMDHALHTAPADVAILDLNLPFEDGISIARRLRRAYPLIGIVMLTARVRPSDRTQGYQSGADVYLTKPASVQELQAVIETLSRRVAAAEELQAVPNATLQAASDTDFELDLATLRLRQLKRVGGPKEVLLTPVEALLLEALARAGGQVVDAQFLIQNVPSGKGAPWDKGHLSVVMTRLRAKGLAHLGSDLSIRSIRGQGYQWAARTQLVSTLPEY